MLLEAPDPAALRARPPGGDGLHDRHPDVRLLAVLVRRAVGAATGNGVDGDPAHAPGRLRCGRDRPGEPFGMREMLALILTLGGVSLAIQRRLCSATGLGGRPEQNVAVQ
jgi:hypothetical protein